MELNSTVNIKETELLNTPIDYKSLNVTDFNPGLEATKEIVDVPNGKYLTEVVINKIIPEDCNTVVINSSVGQGKSTLAIEIAKRYYESTDPKTKRYRYTVIFAVPYKSLIKQYKEKLIEEINKGKKSKILTYIPDYNNLTGEKNEDPENTILNNPDGASSRRMHVVTTNFLLGNPGDSTDQKYLKREYMKLLIQTNRVESRKIVIIFDEIHDCIHNFKQDLIYSLWRFKTSGILHKTFILSATFNEASKVVIKYIAELTDKQLQIIETKREQQEDNLSNLHLYITPKMSYNFNEHEEYHELFRKIIKEHSIVNILSYSQKIATELLENNSIIKKILIGKFSNINLCIAKEHLDRLKSKKDNYENVTFNEYYLPDKCNVGTTFKTGISIEKENSAFIIILPNKYAMTGYISKKAYGILSQGIISIIQALARIREDSIRAKSDIYVIMPTPIGLINLRDISDNNYLNHIQENEIIKNLNIPVNYNSTYIDYKQELQKDIISTKYKEMYLRFKKEIDTVCDLNEKGERKYLPELNYPTEDLFILKKGERYLSSTFAIFGRDFPAYILWAAFNNQFVNCKIKTISSLKSRKIEIELGKIQDMLHILFEEYFGIVDYIFLNITDYEVYSSFNNIIFQNEIIYNKKKIYPSDYLFQQHILSFIQKWIKGNERLNIKYHFPEGRIIDTDNNVHFPDIPFELSDFILCCISNANIYTNENPVENSSVELIQAYKNLEKIYKIFRSDRIRKTNRRQKKYIFQSVADYENEPFTPEEQEMFITSMQEIKASYFIDKVFNGFTSIDLDNSNKGEIINQLYNYFKKVFFKITKNGKSSNSRNIHYIDEIIDLPFERTGINLLYSYNPTLAQRFEEVFDDMLIDNYNNYYKILSDNEKIRESDIITNVTSYIDLEKLLNTN